MNVLVTGGAGFIGSHVVEELLKRPVAEVVVLDNLDVETMRQAVQLVGGRALLEASGGITLETIRAVAETGVDLISVGALTHSAPALDLSLQFHLGVGGPLA